MKEKEAAEKGIDVEKLKEEQRKLARLVELKDSMDFSKAQRFAAIHTETVGKELLATCVLLDEKLEVLEERYAIKRPSLPYISGFRAYRELKVMHEAYQKLQEQPDVIFVEAHGIAHPRGLGLASHLGLSLNKPTIGIAKKILVGKQTNSEVVLNDKVVAKSLVTRKGSKPIYVSPGHLVSLNTAVEITKKCVKEPHKLPEPIVQARKFARKVKQELK